MRVATVVLVLYDCRGPGDHLPDHRGASLAAVFRELDPAEHTAAGSADMSPRLPARTSTLDHKSAGKPYSGSGNGCRRAR